MGILEQGSSCKLMKQMLPTPQEMGYFLIPPPKKKKFVKFLLFTVAELEIAINIYTVKP